MLKLSLQLFSVTMCFIPAVYKSWGLSDVMYNIFFLLKKLYPYLLQLAICITCGYCIVGSGISYSNHCYWCLLVNDLAMILRPLYCVCLFWNWQWCSPNITFVNQLDQLLGESLSEVDWRRSFYLNMIAHTSFSVTVAICR